MSGVDNTELLITSVKVDRKQGKLYQIYIDSIEQPITVHEDIFIKYRLMKGKGLSLQNIDEIIEENGYYLAYEKGIRYLALRARSSEQVAQYLRNQQFHERHVASAVAKLVENKYIDDLIFAEQYVRSKTKSSKAVGKIRLTQELKRLGIADESIKMVLEPYDEEIEFTAAYEQALKKLKSLKGEKHEVSRKLLQYLMRRGYNGAITRKVMQKLENEQFTRFQVDIYGDMLDN